MLLSLPCPPYHHLPVPCHKHRHPYPPPVLLQPHRPRLNKRAAAVSPPASARANYPPLRSWHCSIPRNRPASSHLSLIPRVAVPPLWRVVPRSVRCRPMRCCPCFRLSGMPCHCSRSQAQTGQMQAHHEHPWLALCRRRAAAAVCRTLLSRRKPHLPPQVPLIGLPRHLHLRVQHRPHCLYYPRPSTYPGRIRKHDAYAYAFGSGCLCLCWRPMAICS
jgi:hypothetical protein